MSHALWRGIPLLAAAVLVAAGCRSSLEKSDAETARRELEAALAAWQQGERPDTLRRRDPPLYFTDPDWVAGRRLESFELLQEHEYHGIQVRCFAVLSLAAEQGRPAKRNVTYLVDTYPSLVIVRGDP